MLLPNTSINMKLNKVKMGKLDDAKSWGYEERISFVDQLGELSQVKHMFTLWPSHPIPVYILQNSPQKRFPREQAYGNVHQNAVCGSRSWRHALCRTWISKVWWIQCRSLMSSLRATYTVRTERDLKIQSCAHKKGEPTVSSGDLTRNAESIVSILKQRGNLIWGIGYTGEENLRHWDETGEAA